MTSEQREFARGLRAAATKPEDALWRALRGRRLGGLKFRRQVPPGPYTVDFVCLEHRLVVELDGRQHDWHRAYDEMRTIEIEAMGFVLLRFANELVVGDIDRVKRAINAAIGIAQS